MDDISVVTGSADSAQTNGAIFLDGTSNRKRSVALRLDVDLEIVENGVVVDRWPFDAIRRVDGPAGRLRLMCIKALPLARLEITEPTMQETLLARCHALDTGQKRQTWRIVAWSLAAACSILMLVLFGIPLAADRLAPLVPKIVETWIGEAVDKQARFLFNGTVCKNPEGQTAFTALIDKLKIAGGIEEPLQARVISTTEENAFALPGGRVYLLDGLLQKANNVDEIAGVIAHELGHVRHRDGIRDLIQTGGTSFLIGLLFGDVTGGGAMIFTIRTLLNASYSRDVESAADAFAVTTMHALGRSPKPMGELLSRVTDSKMEKELNILSSHPLTEDRLAAMKKADIPNTGADILSAKEWLALKTICGQPKSK
jgi:Zn-dependent protease with chaperone function